MQFELPESYRAYCSDTAVRTAVDHILSADSKAPLTLPADIEWQDLPAFHRAVLSAHQVRCEFAVLLIDLWDAVWQHALDRWKFGGELEPQTVDYMQDWNGTKLDTDTLWEGRWFGRGLDIGDRGFLLAPGIVVDIEQIRLSLSLYGKDDSDHTTGFDFGAGWPKQDIEDGTAWTRKDLAPIRDDGTIDIDSVHKAAEDALAAVGAHVRG